MIVSELVAKLGLQVDERAFSRATAVMQGLTTGLAGIGAAVGSAVVGLGALVNSTAEAADAIDETAAKAGVSTDALQRLQAVAKFSGLSLEQTGHSLGILSRQAIEAANGSDDLRAAFAKVGIVGADLRKLSADQMFVRIAEHFDNMADGPEKVALAMKLLGRGGAEMLPVLATGSAQIKEIMAEASVMSPEMIKAGAAFTDEKDRVASAIKALRNDIAGPFLEDFTDAARAVRGVIKELRLFAAPKIVAGFRVLTTAVRWLTKNTWALKSALVSLVAFKLAALIPTLTALTWWEVSWGMAALISGARAWAASVLAAAGAALVKAAWVGALLAIVLIFQDVYTWLSGGDSMIGRLIGSWDEFYKGLMADPSASPILKFLASVLDKIINIRSEIERMAEAAGTNVQDSAVARQNRDDAIRLYRGGKSINDLGRLAVDGPGGANLGVDAFMAALWDKARSSHWYGIAGEEDMRAQLAEAGVSNEEFDAWWKFNPEGNAVAPPSIMSRFGGGASPEASAGGARGAGGVVSQRVQVQQTINAAAGQSAEDIGKASAGAIADALQGPLQEAAAAINH